MFGMDYFADVWALGVLLYKLCYYTTPFEEHGPLAIVNAKYTFPPYPVYSPVMQHLIGMFPDIRLRIAETSTDHEHTSLSQRSCWWNSLRGVRRWSTSTTNFID